MDQQFQQYLENVIALEKNSYIQTRALRRLDAKIQSLGKPRNITKSYAEDQSGDLGTNFSIVWGCGITGAFLCGIISGLVNLRHLKFFGGLLKGALWGGLGGLALGFAIVLICRAIDKGRLRREQQELNEAYEKKVAADNSRLAREAAQKTRLITLRNELKAQSQKTNASLQQFYAVNLIYPKYRTLPAVSSFYDYFMSGRCTELTGHEGAYNLYESELRLGVIQDKLDEISGKLDVISNSQHQLYMVMSDSNRKISRLISETEKQTQLASFTAEQSAIIAYNTEEMRAELNQLKWLKTFEMLQS